MKMNKKLSEIFNIEPVDTKELLPVEPTPFEQQDDDFDLARNTLRNLIKKNEAVITDLVDLARNSEHPRAYEVAGQLIKTQSDIAKDLLEIHQQKKELTGESVPIKTQNNVIFAGSTSDLMKMISAQRAKTIDSE